MKLWEELWRLYQPVKEHAVLTQRYRRHPVQLRLVAKGRFNASYANVEITQAVSDIFDRLVAKHYID